MTDQERFTRIAQKYIHNRPLLRYLAEIKLLEKVK